MTIPSAAVVTWDLSLEQDNSIKGWLLVNSTDSTMYDLYIGSNIDIYANSNSSYLFYYLTAVKEINFDNFNTSEVTNMATMF